MGSVELLRLYEEIRKPRAIRLVNGAEQMCKFDHMIDGPEQELRDAEMRGSLVLTLSMETLNSNH